ncbi:MAG: DUF2202 domain-containing protein [Hydrogenophaga sp.]|uniref:DUF2202 domain-containing protein n=1 Tax=Hydrogenophaga sp. TaxID=1904254 RepID=UPI002718A707|nr:DUF2202 domain-containing protein [Hydrogenophaga sp.]MDO9032690.1 DUF2202 domain-containing protein [Hydrogenophaga sp.]
MNHPTITRFSAIFLASLALVACGGGTDEDLDKRGSPTSVNTLPMEALSQAETDSLLYMREEEKLAGDVYTRMDALWGGSVPVFGNITHSEASHTEAVRQLLQRYGLPDPVADNAVGVFRNPDLQALYHQLVADGSVSLIAALQVGDRIEELDMLDINTHLARVDNQDIRVVYESLLRGSRNHLRAYHQTLLKQGGSYTPQYLSQAEFDAIVNSAMERG